MQFSHRNIHFLGQLPLQYQALLLDYIIASALEIPMPGGGG
jgi:hypothetical protein